MNDLLLSTYQMGSIKLQNRIVMLPMTRNRAIGNTPNEIMAEYYGQRASAGLIITEGTAPSPNALGYANIPGIFTKEQVEKWKLTTDTVHKKGGKIVVQLMHTGRMGNPKNLPKGAELIAPSALPAIGKAIKNTQRTNEYHTPREMNLEDILNVQMEFVNASKNAIEAGFDGVELHGANEHIIEQFLSPISNHRMDDYGGSFEKRCRFVLETIQNVGAEIGFDKVGIRLSPFGANSWENDNENTFATYNYLSTELNKFRLAYLHHVDHTAIGGNAVPIEIKQKIRENFKNTILISGGFNPQSAQETIENNLADLVGFGRPFIGNPDLVERIKNNWEINTNLDTTTFYSSEAKGYTDYPTFKN